MPQNDLLGHPSVQLFINHGGNYGQYEALYHGVPMLTMPLFLDQFHNAYRVEQHGYGLILHWNDLTSQTLNDKMDAILADSTFKKRIRETANMIRTMPMDARQTVAFWIGHVLRFGADHLRSASTDLLWYEYWMLDIILFMVSTVVLILISFTILMLWMIWPLMKKSVEPGPKTKKEWFKWCSIWKKLYFVINYGIYLYVCEGRWLLE